MTPDFKRFSAISMFSDFTLRQLTPIFDKIQAFSYAAGEIILQPGSTRIGLYFVIDGLARIYTNVEDQEITLAAIHPGDFFGEISVVENRPPSAFARAEEETLIYFLSQKDFQDLTAEGSTLAAKIWEALVRVVITRLTKSNGMVLQYFHMNKALCENPKFREFYQLCQFGN